jgi:hypothetical protein
MERQGVELVFWHWFFGTGFFGTEFCDTEFCGTGFATPGFCDIANGAATSGSRRRTARRDRPSPFPPAKIAFGG